MALSLNYSCMETMEHPFGDMGMFCDHPEISDELLSFCESFDEPQHLPLNSIFDPPDDIFCTEKTAAAATATATAVFSYDFPYSQSIPCSEFNNQMYQSPKRMKKNCSVVCDPYNFMYDYSNVYNIPEQAPELFPELVEPPPWAEELLSRGENKASNGCLSTQSIAARQRRKKISDKTQELSRLIPGGTKMNTAEMLQAAFKYVKFLQAQVGILSFMNSTDHQECRGLLPGEEQLQVLLESPKIHEKLYSEGRCLIPEKMVGFLLEDQQVKLSKNIHRDLIRRFVESIQQPQGCDEKELT